MAAAKSDFEIGANTVTLVAAVLLEKVALSRLSRLWRAESVDGLKLPFVTGSRTEIAAEAGVADAKEENDKAMTAAALIECNMSSSRERR